MTTVRTLWRKVKRWALSHIHPPREIEVPLCPACRREVKAAPGWIVWNHELWHVACLARRRGWRLDAADPASVLPDLSVRRHEADAREPGYSAPTRTVQ